MPMDFGEWLRNLFIAIPSHVINKDIEKIAKEQGIILIQTLGVLQTMSLDEISREKTSQISLTSAKVGVVLGGDAEMPNGKDWQLFNSGNAKKFATEIAAFYKKTGYKMLITNGPRTGAFIEDSKRNINAHKDGKLDEVSKAFLNQLQKEGLEDKKDFEFFDFQFGKPSELKAIIAIIHKNAGFMIVPGESTSSISEIISVVPAVVYENSAMSDIHMLFLKLLTDHKQITVWPDVPNQKAIDSYAPMKSEAHKVIKEILK